VRDNLVFHEISSRRFRDQTDGTLLEEVVVVEVEEVEEVEVPMTEVAVLVDVGVEVATKTEDGEWKISMPSMPC